MMSLVGLVVGLVLSDAKGAFGDLFRAMGLAALLAAHRSRRLSAEYPFLPYARRALAMLPRRPFPPAENPWKYKRAEALAEMEEAGVVDDGNLPAEFSMAKVFFKNDQQQRCGLTLTHFLAAAAAAAATKTCAITGDHS